MYKKDIIGLNLRERCGDGEGGKGRGGANRKVRGKPGVNIKENLSLKLRERAGTWDRGV